MSKHAAFLSVLQLYEARDVLLSHGSSILVARHVDVLLVSSTEPRISSLSGFSLSCELGREVVASLTLSF